MKKNYIEPKIIIEQINLDDIIATSTDPIEGVWDEFDIWPNEKDIFEL